MDQGSSDMHQAKKIINKAFLTTKHGFTLCYAKVTWGKTGKPYQAYRRCQSSRILCGFVTFVTCLQELLKK